MKAEDGEFGFVNGAGELGRRLRRGFGTRSEQVYPLVHTAVVEAML